MADVFIVDSIKSTHEPVLHLEKDPAKVFLFKEVVVRLRFADEPSMGQTDEIVYCHDGFEIPIGSFVMLEPMNKRILRLNTHEEVFCPCLITVLKDAMEIFMARKRIFQTPKPYFKVKMTTTRAERHKIQRSLQE